MLTGVHHITLRVRDLERSRGFYEGALGLFCDQDFAPGEVEGHPDGKLRFRVGLSTRLVVIPASPIGSAIDAVIGVDHVALSVDEKSDLFNLVVCLEKAGLSTEGVQLVSGGGELVGFRDPDGNQLEFFHQTASRAPGLAAFIIPVQDRRVLLARMNYAPDAWDLPGGMVEPGEGIDDAARREVREETGLDVTTEQLVAVGDHGSLVFFVFVGRVTGGELVAQEDEIAELRWFSADELEALGSEGISAWLGVKALCLEGIRGLGLRNQASSDGSTFPVFTDLT